MKKISIVFFGTPSFSAYILRRLIESKKFNVRAVVTNPDRASGRKQVLTPSPVAQLAQKHGISILRPEKLDNSFLTTNYSLLTTHLFIVASYGKIIPQTLLDVPKYGSINVHGSLLPKYRGASPIQAAILAGDKETGITIMLMDKNLDHGPILTTKKIRLSNRDNFETLSKKIAQISAPILITTIEDFITGKIKPRVQNHAIATFCPLIKKENGYFDINNPPLSQTLDRMIRAYYPWPGVWTRFRASPAEAAAKVEQGSSGQARLIKFLPGGLVQMEGKKPTPLKNFLKGYPDFPLKNL